jgi:hypothetical protein|tara:strand:+ start:298 stop:471 length:174 start_codon:yes stop_codon:yes gene_type:complete
MVLPREPEQRHSIETGEIRNIGWLEGKQKQESGRGRVFLFIFVLARQGSVGLAVGFK